MGVVMAAAIVMAICAYLLFFLFPPKYAKPEQLSVFNWSVIGVVVMLSVVWLMNADILFKGAAFDNYRSFSTVIVLCGIHVAVLVVFFIARNFWIFKPAKTWGRRF